MLKIIYLFSILLFLNLSALIDKVLHPDYPYFTYEHIISGIISSSLTALILGVALVYIKRLGKIIHKHKQVETQLRENEDKFRSLVESTEDSIYLVDSNYRYIFMNRKHKSRLGLSDAEYEGREFSDFHSPMETKIFVEKCDRVLDTCKSATYEYKSLRDGRYFLQTFSPVKKEGGQTKAVAIISKNITKLKQMEKELIYLSNTDELTGLYNRRGFFNLMEHRLKLARRQQNKLLLLYIDIDNFKKINDTYGHQEGDLILRDVARLLKNTYRESDVIARMGGDEFVVFPIGAMQDHIETIISRIQTNLAEYNKLQNRDYDLSLSFGISCFDHDSFWSVDELLAQSDKSMYEHKREKSV